MWRSASCILIAVVVLWLQPPAGHASLEGGHDGWGEDYMFHNSWRDTDCSITGLCIRKFGSIQNNDHVLFFKHYRSFNIWTCSLLLHSGELMINPLSQLMRAESQITVMVEWGKCSCWSLSVRCVLLEMTQEVRKSRLWEWSSWQHAVGEVLSPCY